MCKNIKSPPRYVQVTQKRWPGAAFLSCVTIAILLAQYVSHSSQHSNNGSMVTMLLQFSLFVTVCNSHVTGRGYALLSGCVAWSRRIPRNFLRYFYQVPTSTSPAQRRHGPGRPGWEDRNREVLMGRAGGWWPRNNDMRGILSSEPRPGYPQCSDQNTS